ncbi:MAG: pimeloyl-ACP methyl ester esterase BioH [Gammaproteobacteria bacterium]
MIFKEVFGSGQPLVMVHGWAMHSGIWRDFAVNLSRRMETTCLDLPGHGFSSPVEPYDLESLADALADAAPDRPACWLGWSLGASVALELSQRRPELVSSLIVMSGNPRFTRTADWPGMDESSLKQFAGRLMQDPKTTLLRFLSLQILGQENPKAMLKTLKRNLDGRPSADQAALSGGLKILMTADKRDSLSALKCPVLIIQGGRDTLVPGDAGEAMRRLARTSRLCYIEKAGHVPFLTHESEILDTIFRFIANSQ